MAEEVILHLSTHMSPDKQSKLTGTRGSPDGQPKTKEHHQIPQKKPERAFNGILKNSNSPRSDNKSFHSQFDRKPRRPEFRAEVADTKIAKKRKSHA